jgi:pyruvate-ferredoxin/flavodoxin oxidoreductase
MAPFGKAWKGKEEIRKEMGLIGLAHRSSYVMQGSMSNVTHLIEGYIDGLNSRRPALFNIYAVCQPEHGVGDDMSEHQSKLAVESRAYPLMKFDPDQGDTIEECIDIEGNPSIDADWPTYTLKYQDEKGNDQQMSVPMTFADFAMTEGRFRKQFRNAPPETWNEDMIPVSEFIDLDTDDREGKFPYIWGVDGKNRLMRVLVSQEMALSCIERRHFWRQLKGLAGEMNKVDVDAIIAQTKADMAQKLTNSLFAMASGGGNVIDMVPGNGGNGAALTATGGGNGAAAGDWEAVWIETPECTACDECVEIAPGIFQYNDDSKAVVIDPKAGAYKDVVKAAEKCTAGCIHPGTPWNPNEKDLDKLVKRAEKFQ